MTRKLAALIFGLSGALLGALAVACFVFWLADSTLRGGMLDLVAGVALSVGAAVSLFVRRQLLPKLLIEQGGTE